VPEIDGIAATVFAPSCATAACHAAEAPAVGLDLASPGVATRLVGAQAASCDRLLVAPGNPEASFLLDKIREVQPACGTRMPPAGAALDEASIACIESWIAALPAGCERCGEADCVDLDTDRRHCGDCSTSCPSGAACEAGTCACTAPTTACDGACVDTSSDPEHCGDCGAPCNPQLVCSLGACKQGCDAGLAQCGSACVDVTTNAAHCGECDHGCGAGGTCNGGQCECPGGADPMSDPQNCGTCGNVCAPGQSCRAGACTCGTASVSFSGDVAPILTSHCATNGCHAGAQPKEGLDLQQDVAWSELVQVPAEQCGDGRLRVAPGDPAQSYLVDKILGVDLCSGTKMPKLETLPAADVTVISNWVCAGALGD
jgi:hypothetical protein